MTRSPRETALEYAACLQSGEFERLVTLHHPDLVCSLLGSTLVSGRFRGRDAFYDHTFKHVRGEFADTGEAYHKSSRIACADDQVAVLLLHGGLPTRRGGRYDQNYLQVYRVANGLIVELHELLDTVMLETQIFGKRLAIPRSPPAEPLQPDSRFRSGTGLAPAGDAAALAQRFGEALDAASGQVLRTLLHPDAVLQIAGSTPVSGTVRGRDAIALHLAAHFERHFVTGGPRIDAPSRLVCADDRGFCRLATASGQLQDGAPYRQTLGIVGQYAGDSVAELYLYFDAALEERLVFGNPLTGGSVETAPEPFVIDSALESARGNAPL